MSIPLSGGCTVFEAWENWGVTVPGFWRESDEMRYLSGKSMGVQVLCTILEDKKRKLQNRTCRKMYDQRNLQMFYMSFFKHKESVH